MEEKEISKEQLIAALKQSQMQLMEADQRFKNINMTAMRLDYLFQVLKYRECFNVEFIEKTAEEIEAIMFPVETEEETEE